MPSTVKVLLMAGGRGTRLWPKSRESTPKQFMPFRHHRTLFQQTVQRIADFVPANHIYAVTPPDYVPLIEQQTPQLAQRIIVEPDQHGTTASLCYALLWLRTVHTNPDDIVVLLPTDAYVSDDESYRQCLQDAVKVAQDTDGTVTIGIRPTYPATGYGYIQTCGERIDPGLSVQRFIEKPGLAEAKLYFAQPEYFWNSGIFVWKFSVIWRLIEKHLPVCYEQLMQWHRQRDTLAPGQLLAQYLRLPAIAFEYAIVERATKLYMIPAAFDWTDLGTWSALMEASSDGLVRKRVIAVDTNGCLVESPQRLVGLFGVSDLIVVDTEDVLFICHKNREQDMKQFLKAMRERGYEQYL